MDSRVCDALTLLCVPLALRFRLKVRSALEREPAASSAGAASAGASGSGAASAAPASARAALLDSRQLLENHRMCSELAGLAQGLYGARYQKCAEMGCRGPCGRAPQSQRDTCWPGSGARALHPVLERAGLGDLFDSRDSPSGQVRLATVLLKVSSDITTDSPLCFVHRRCPSIT